MGQESLTRRATMESEPEQGATGARRVLDLLQQYFFVPSQEGFSAYRTGWLVHVAFSVIVAVAFSAGVVALGFNILHGVAVAALAVTLLWGVGVWVGVYSHYSPLILLAALAVVFGFMFYPPAAPYSLLSWMVAGAVHAAIVPVLVFLLKQLRKLFAPGPGTDSAK